MTEHSTGVTEKFATSESWHVDVPLETWHQFSSWAGFTALWVIDDNSGHCVWTLYGEQRSWEFMFSIYYLSFNVFQKRKPPSKLVLGFFWTWLFCLMVNNLERRGGTALGDSLKALSSSLPCHPPTLKQHVLRLSRFESQRVGGITVSGSHRFLINSTTSISDFKFCQNLKTLQCLSYKTLKVKWKKDHHLIFLHFPVNENIH